MNKLEIELITFTPDMATELGDLYDVLIVIEEPIGGKVCRLVIGGIFSFNDQCFISSGNKIPNERVVAYGHWDIDKVSNMKFE